MEDIAGHTTQHERLRAVVEEVLTSTDLYLVDLDLRGRKGSQVLDVFVDADEAVDVDRLAHVSRELGFVLETEELISGRYHLNVSSPGLDRPLVLPRQYPKHVGRMLRVTYRTGDGGADAAAHDRETVVGELRSADDEAIALAARGEARDAEPRRIPYTAILQAHVQLPW